MNTFELEINKSLHLIEDDELIIAERIKDDRFNIRPSKFDFWTVTCKGEFFGLEAKSTRQKSLPFQNIQPHQIDILHLLDTVFKNCHGVFLINFRLGKGKIFCFALSASQVYEFIQTADRKSIPFLFCTENGLYIPRLPTKGSILWDLNHLFNLKD